MVEELKAEMRKLENLIGFEGKVDVTSRAFTQELIRALDSKYKDDVKNSVRLHQLEFYHDLIESARHQQIKHVEVEEKFLLEEKNEKKDDDDEKEVEEQVKEKELFKKPEDVVSIRAENIDEWKDLMTLARIYYVLEHPNSTGITWKRRITKKKSISKFSDKDLIEWRVAENFKLRGLEEWALSRSEARKVAEKSPYDFDDLLEDDESRELEDMFNILGTQKQKKRKVGKLEKSLKSNRPFKFKDEGVEDWTESYSDDSEESGAEDMAEEILEIDEDPDFKIEEYKVSSEEPAIDEEETISEIFSVYEEKPKFRNPIFEELDKTETMEQWFDLCHKSVGEPKAAVFERPPIPQFLFTIEDREDEKFSETDIPDDIGYIRGQEIEVTEAKEKDIERPGGRIPVKEVKEEDLEKPGDDSEEQSILASYQGETMHIKEAREKDIERPGERIPIKEAEEKDIEPKRDFEKQPSFESADTIFDGMESLDEIELSHSDEEFDGMSYLTNYHAPLKPSEKKPGKEQGKLIDQYPDMQLETSDLPKESVITSEKGTVSKDNEEDLGDQIKKMMNEGKDYALSDAKNEAVYAPASKEPSTSSERQAAKNKSVTSFEKQLTGNKSATSSETHATKKKSATSSENPATKKKSATSSEIQPTKKKSVTSPEIQPIKKKSDISTEKPATKKKSVTSPEIQPIKKKSDISSEKPPTKKKSVTSPEIQPIKKKSDISAEKPVTKKKSVTSPEKQQTEKKSVTSPKRQPTKKKSDTSSEKKVTKKKSVTSPEKQETLKKSSTFPERSKSYLGIDFRSESSETRIKELLGHMVDEAKVDALEEKEKEYYKRRATLSPDDSNSKNPDLERILKSESSLKIAKSRKMKDDERSKADISQAEDHRFGTGR